MRSIMLETFFCFDVQEPENLVVERREGGPALMNAFELISTSQGLNLGTLFEKQMVTSILNCSILYISQRKRVPSAPC